MDKSINEAKLTGKADGIVRVPNRHTAVDLMPYLLNDAGLEFVPVEKFTLAVVFGILKDRVCSGCDGDCTKCVITTVLNKLEDSVNLRPMLDADMNVIAYETDANGNVVRKPVVASET